MNRIGFLLAVGLSAFSVEARGQISVFNFPLDGSQQVPPNPSMGTGFGSVVLDQSSGVVDVFCTYEGLTSAVTVAHIHGPAPPGQNAGVIVPLSPTGGTSGFISDVGLMLSPGQVQAMLAGNTYVNIHTGQFPGGEIRGQIVQAVSCAPDGCDSSVACTFDGLPNHALGEARLSLNEDCNLVISNIGSSGQDGVTQNPLPSNTELMITNLGAPNFGPAPPGVQMRIEMFANVPGGLFSTLVVEKLDPSTLRAEVDFSPIGNTLHTVTVENAGQVVGQWTDLALGACLVDNTDAKEGCCDACTGEVTFALCGPNSITVIGGGTVVGDRITFTAQNPSVPLPRIQRRIDNYFIGAGAIEMTAQFAGASGPEVPFCFGDGLGTACPCGNQGQAGEGCANGTGVGAVLIAGGSASLAAGDFALTAFQLAPSQPGLYFQGDQALNGGNGFPFGDGLRCVGVNVIRLEIVNANGNGGSQSSIDIGVAGGVSPGDTKHYQLWYRDPLGTPCGATFNLTPALELQWVP